LKGIVQSKDFYLVFITGLSGNGKTVMVEQVCTLLGRECLRVNISIETNQTDLLGGFALIDGNTIFHDGPVIQR
jgi:MoxR-like ATPase